MTISFLRHPPLEFSHKKMPLSASSIHDLIPSEESIPGGLLFSSARFRFNSTLKNNHYEILLLTCPKNGEADTFYKHGNPSDSNSEASTHRGKFLA
jgi:hypothetical protein